MNTNKAGWPWINPQPTIYEAHINWPKISIVTPSFNQGQFIEETILSIINQGYPNIEYIIIDGGSTDQTLDIVKKYDGDITFWVSEKDRGQSHAINKGIDKCTGEIFNWINSDDVMLQGSLKAIGKSFIENPTLEVSAFKAKKFGQVISEMIVPRTQEKMSLEQYLFQFWLMQPSTFFKLSIFKTLGGLKEVFHYCMDTEFFIRYFLLYGTEKMMLNEKVILKFRMHEMSKSISSQLKFNEERLAIDLAICRSVLQKPSEESYLDQISRTELKSIEMASSIAINQLDLKASFDAKWRPWIEDLSLKYRSVAEYAAWYGDTKNQRIYSLKAIQMNPFKTLNWKYLANALLKR